MHCANNSIELNFTPLLEEPLVLRSYSPYSPSDHFRISTVPSVGGHTSHGCLCTLPTCVICLPILKYSFTLIVNGAGKDGNGHCLFLCLWLDLDLHPPERHNRVKIPLYLSLCHLVPTHIYI